MRINKFVLAAIILIASCGLSYAGNQYVVDPAASTVKGSIRYIVVGKYVADFKEFAGIIEFNAKKSLLESKQSLGSVELRVRVDSLESNFPNLDGIVKSRRLLDAGKYPEAVFIGEKILKTKEGYEVEALVDFHGIRKKMTFPFDLEFKYDPATGKTNLHASGVWSVNRKDFDISWNKLLDHGGIIVANTFQVEWVIAARPQP